MARARARRFADALLNFTDKAEHDAVREACDWLEGPMRDVMRLLLTSSASAETTRREGECLGRESDQSAPIRYHRLHADI